jgi:hypothetical protein
VTGPLIEFNIKQINPLDARVSSVRYDIQTSIPGPTTTFTGSFVYRESRTDLVANSSLYVNTSITNHAPYTGSMDVALSENMPTAFSVDFTEFYDRAYFNAQAYFINSLAGSQSIKAFTGSASLPTPGVTGSFYEEADI